MSHAQEPQELRPGEPRPNEPRLDEARPHEPRPLIERIGLAVVAAVLAILFGGVAAASWIGGELFLAIMGAVGCLMTLWVGAVTLVRG
ncbi:MAG: hypothetical protein ABI553_10985 [Chloroflexota bacterium]